MKIIKFLWEKNYYSYSQADIIENPTVADLGKIALYRMHGLHWNR